MTTQSDGGSTPSENTLEFALLGRMTTDEGMKEVTEARVSAKVLFEPVCSNAFAYALEYRGAYGSPPTLRVFGDEFPGLAEMIEKSAADVEEPTGWIIEKLREHYVTNTLQVLVTEAAETAFEDSQAALRKLVAGGQAALEAAGADSSALLDRLSHDGAWLDAQQFAPLEYAVDGIVPEGLGMLVAPPKKGKSWLVGNIGLAVARGGFALGAILVTQRPVLYLALEDGHKRLQNRFRQMLAGQPIPDGITVVTRATPAEAMDVIAGFMERHASQRPLVILDTFGKVKRHKRPSEDSYLVDYEAGAALKALCDAVPGSSLLVVHHTRKAMADDFVDMVSGTQGIAGSVDFVLVLTRKRHENNAILSVTGRDIAEGEYALHADDGVLWRLDGADLDAARENVAQRQAEASLGDRQMDVYLAVAAASGPITAVDVAGQLEDMDNDAAGQYLRRLSAGGHIHKISRGVFSLNLARALPPTDTTEEEDEDGPKKNVSEVGHHL